MARGIWTKQSGTWKEVKQPYIKHNGTWKAAKEVYVKQSGTWKLAWPPEHGFVVETPREHHQCNVGPTYKYTYNIGDPPAAGEKRIVHVLCYVTTNYHKITIGGKTPIKKGEIIDGLLGHWQSITCYEVEIPTGTTVSVQIDIDRTIPQAPQNLGNVLLQLYDVYVPSGKTYHIDVKTAKTTAVQGSRTLSTDWGTKSEPDKIFGIMVRHHLITNTSNQLSVVGATAVAREFCQISVYGYQYYFGSLFYLKQNNAGNHATKISTTSGNANGSMLMLTARVWIT